MASTKMNSWGWTGINTDVREREDRARTIQIAVDAQRNHPAPETVPVVVAERPAPKPYVPIKYDPVHTTIKGYTAAQIKEYSELAAIVGVSPADLKVEQFKTYLGTKDFPVYDLLTVVSFMDDKSKAEGRGWGWNWVPLREKDRIDAFFGQQATRREVAWGGRSSEFIGEDRPASDHYSSHRDSGMGSVRLAPVYDKVVPLHALKKVALIEKEFGGEVAFMVSDYAPAPAFKADPFLMAVVNNSRVSAGEGRFVIDVWDEPGFGIEQMLK